VLYASLNEVSRCSTYSLILGCDLVTGGELGALGAVLAHAAFVSIVERHAAIHSAALSLMDLAAAGWTLSYVRRVGAGNDNLAF
jgi:hypothetical protein